VSFLNSVIDNIKNRRSIRRYLAKKLPKKVIEELIGSAIYAPSSHNRQPWEFTIVTDNKVIDELSADINSWYSSIIKLSTPLYLIKEVKEFVKAMRARVKSEKDLFFYKAPCVIVIHAPKKRFYAQDCACVAQNLMLASRSLDIGSCWIGFADIVFNRSRKIKKKLGIPYSHGVMATVALGYTEKFPSKALPRKQVKKKWI
jgi:nitroreductase